MGIISIEESAYLKMKLCFEGFAKEIEELCATSGVSKEWLDGQDVCKLLDISKRTLQHYRDYGKLPFSMIGKKCYYKASDVTRLLQESSIK